jgi:hypothetical protein
MNVQEAGCEFDEIHDHNLKHVSYFKERFKEKLAIISFEFFIKLYTFLGPAIHYYPRKQATDRIGDSIDEETGR